MWISNQCQSAKQGIACGVIDMMEVIGYWEINQSIKYHWLYSVCMSVIDMIEVIVYCVVNQPIKYRLAGQVVAWNVIDMIDVIVYCEINQSISYKRLREGDYLSELYTLTAFRWYQ